MTSTASPDASAPAIRWQTLTWQAVIGFLFGCAALHPAAMVIFHWLDPRCGAIVGGGTAGAVFGPIVHSFRLDMLCMGVVFGAIGALITTFYGYHRLMVAAQRDRLAEQAEILRQSNQDLARLELANRRTSQFMAHDFKTALGCVAGHATQLLKQPRLREDHDVASALVSIRRQAHGMMGSVTDLLEFARVREKGDPRMELVSASGLLQEAMSDFSLPMHEEQITLGDNHPRCPPVLASDRLLRRVLCNLISNAVKHNGPDTQVWLDTELDDSRKEVLFSCCDNGAGIPPETLPTIFAEFVGTNECLGESTGLGLAFCKAVVEAHGGRLWCESAEQQGARFFFTVPMRKESRDDE